MGASRHFVHLGLTALLFGSAASQRPGNLDTLKLPYAAPFYGTNELVPLYDPPPGIIFTSNKKKTYSPFNVHSSSSQYPTPPSSTLLNDPLWPPSNAHQHSTYPQYPTPPSSTLLNNQFPLSPQSMNHYSSDSRRNEPDYTSYRSVTPQYMPPTPLSHNGQPYHNAPPLNWPPNPTEPMNRDSRHSNQPDDTSYRSVNGRPSTPYYSKPQYMPPTPPHNGQSYHNAPPPNQPMNHYYSRHSNQPDDTSYRSVNGRPSTPYYSKPQYMPPTPPHNGQSYHNAPPPNQPMNHYYWSDSNQPRYPSVKDRPSTPYYQDMLPPNQYNTPHNNVGHQGNDQHAWALERNQEAYDTHMEAANANGYAAHKANLAGNDGDADKFKAIAEEHHKQASLHKAIPKRTAAPAEIVHSGDNAMVSMGLARSSIQRAEAAYGPRPQTQPRASSQRATTR